MARTILGTTAVAATAALAAATPLTPASAATTTHHERGVVVECTGTVAGRQVYASLYENNRFGNELQVVFDRGDGPGKGRTQDARLVRAGTVDATIRVGGRPVRITGTATRTRHVRDVDATHEGVRAVGTHRRLRTDLSVTYRGRTAPLECDTAFRYALRVTSAD